MHVRMYVQSDGANACPSVCMTDAGSVDVDVDVDVDADVDVAVAVDADVDVDVAVAAAAIRYCRSNHSTPSPTTHVSSHTSIVMYAACDVCVCM